MVGESPYALAMAVLEAERERLQPALDYLKGK